MTVFLQTTHFVKSRAHSPRPTRKIIATMALRRAILMKADPVVSLHAHRLLSGRACSCRKDPVVINSLESFRGQVGFDFDVFFDQIDYCIDGRQNLSLNICFI